MLELLQELAVRSARDHGPILTEPVWDRSVPASDGQGRAALQRQQARHLPTAQRVSQERRCVSEKWQLPYVGAHETLPPVELRRTPIHQIGIGEIPGIDEGLRGHRPLGAPSERQIVGALRPGIIRADRQSTRESLLQAQLQRVEAREPILVGEGDIRKSLKYAARVRAERAARSVGGRVQLFRNVDVVGARTHIRDTRQPILRQLPLDREIPVEDVGVR